MEEDFVDSASGWTFNTIKPFMFEPPAIEKTSHSCNDGGISDLTEDFTNNSEPEVDDDATVENRIGTLNWCSCCMCTHLNTENECLCCQEDDDVAAMFVGPCITDSPLFKLHCLNRDCLLLAYYAYAESHPNDNTLIHKQYRHVAYRQFVRWVWRRLGKGNRRILPSCVVTAIRKEFPSEEPYCGFRYIRL